jgi:hypothetical protein
MLLEYLLPFINLTTFKLFYSMSFATGWTVRGLDPGGSEILLTRPDRPWDPPNLLLNWYRLSFPGVKRPGRGVDHPPKSSAKVKERVQLYLYSPSGSSWPVLGWTLSPTSQMHRPVVNPSKGTMNLNPSALRNN